LRFCFFVFLVGCFFVVLLFRFFGGVFFCGFVFSFFCDFGGALDVFLWGVFLGFRFFLN
jgi:hypothetical protein